MKKALYLLTFMSIFAFTANAQNHHTAQGAGPMPQGSKQINLGVGFSNYGMPIYGGMDFGVGSDITVGFELGYQQHTEHYWKHRAFSAAAIGNYHFNRILNIPNNWDFYAGLSIGYISWSHSWDHDGHHNEWDGDDYNSGLGLGLQVGGRYYFNNNWGINLEFNGGNRISGGRVGVSYKF